MMKFALESVMTLLAFIGLAAVILAVVLGIGGLLTIDVPATLISMVLVAGGLYVLSVGLWSSR
jgi:hypothetical protein